ncbi:MAG: CHRD domain-containing protein, partial [Actinomycetota bacterium]|nr:CHRD domain-containing protein [Actinomycetota bacterium]
VLLLTNTPGNVGQNNLDFLEELGCFVNRVGFAGGYVAITLAAEDQIRAAATSDQACNLELTPESATNIVGETHTVTAEVTTNAGAPVETGTVRFEVYDEFQISETQTARSLFLVETVTVGADGTATFSYQEIFPGPDFIVACVVPEGESCTTGDPMTGENVEPRRDLPAIDTARKNWEADLISALFGTAVVPGPGDPDGFGFGSATVTGDGRFCYGIGVIGIQQPPTGASLNAAPFGETGTAVIDLEPPDQLVTFTDPGLGDITAGLAADCIEGLDEALLAAIEANPSDYYFSVTTDEFPEGAVRGQLFPAELEQQVFEPTLFATLTGAAEVPGPGDLDGGGVSGISVSDDGQYLCFLIGVEGIELPATGAHIHEAPEGQAGDIVVNLVAPQAIFFAPPGAGGSFGCVDEDALAPAADPDEFQQILANPENYYVNVHTTEFPAGAIRGQLSTEPPPEGEFFAARPQGPDLPRKFRQGS